MLQKRFKGIMMQRTQLGEHTFFVKLAVWLGMILVINGQEQGMATSPQEEAIYTWKSLGVDVYFITLLVITCVGIMMKWLFILYQWFDVCYMFLYVPHVCYDYGRLTLIAGMISSCMRRDYDRVRMTLFHIARRDPMMIAIFTAPLGKAFMVAWFQWPFGAIVFAHAVVIYVVTMKERLAAADRSRVLAAAEPEFEISEVTDSGWSPPIVTKEEEEIQEKEITDEGIEDVFEPSGMSLNERYVDAMKVVLVVFIQSYALLQLSFAVLGAYIRACLMHDIETNPGPAYRDEIDIYIAELLNPMPLERWPPEEEILFQQDLELFERVRTNSSRFTVDIQGLSWSPDVSPLEVSPMMSDPENSGPCPCNNCVEIREDYAEDERIAVAEAAEQRERAIRWLAFDRAQGRLEPIMIFLYRQQRNRWWSRRRNRIWFNWRQTLWRVQLALRHDVETNPGPVVFSKPFEEADTIGELYSRKTRKRIRRKVIKYIRSMQDVELKSLLRQYRKVLDKSLQPQMLGIDGIMSFLPSLAPRLEHSVTPELGNVLSGIQEAVTDLNHNVKSGVDAVDGVQSAFNRALDRAYDLVVEVASSKLTIVLVCLLVRIATRYVISTSCESSQTVLYQVVDACLVGYCIYKFGALDPISRFLSDVGLIARCCDDLVPDFEIGSDSPVSGQVDLCVVSQSAITTLGKAIMGLLYAVIYQKHAGDQDFEPLLKSVAEVPKYQKGILSLFDYVLDIFKVFTTFASSHWDFAGVIRKESLVPNLDSLIERVEALVVRFRQPDFPIDHATCEVVFDLEREIHRTKWGLESSRDVRYNDAKMILNDLYLSIRVICQKMAAHSKTQKSCRVATTPICFIGPPGTGKTVAMERLGEDVTPAIIPEGLRDRYITDPESIIYTRNRSDEFMSGYDNHLVIRCDELGALNESSGGEDVNGWLEFLYMCSSGPMITTQAQVWDKGVIPMRAYLFIAGSNMRTAQTIKTLAEKRAVVRRMIAIALAPKKEYATPETRDATDPMDRKLIDCAQAGVPFSTDVWEWSLRDFGSGKVVAGTGEARPWCELVEFVIATVKAKIARFETECEASSDRRAARVREVRALEGQMNCEIGRFEWSAEDVKRAEEYAVYCQRRSAMIHGSVPVETITIETKWVERLKSSCSLVRDKLVNHPVLVAIGAIVVGFALLWPTVRPQLEGQSGRAVKAKATRATRKPRHVVTRKARPDISPHVAMIKDNHFDIAHKVMKNNSFALRTTHDDKIFGFAVIIQGLSVLCPAHYWDALDTMSETRSDLAIEFIPVVIGDKADATRSGLSFTVYYHDIEKSVRYLDGYDQSMFELPPVTYQRKSIVGLFPEESLDLDNFYAVLCKPCTSLTPTLKEGRHVMCESPNGGYVLAPIWCTRVLNQTWKKGEVESRDDLGYAYDLRSCNGFCGTLAFIAHPLYTGKVVAIGIHTAGVTGVTGFASAVSQSSLRLLLRTLYDPDLLDNELDGQCAINCNLPPTYVVEQEFVGKIDESPSRIQRGIMYGCTDYPDIKRPSLMRAVLRDGKVIDPRKNAVLLYNKNSAPVNMELLDDVKSRYHAEVVRSSEPLDAPPFVPTPVETIEGVPGRFPCMEDNKSPGLPWVLEGLKRPDIWGPREARDFYSPTAQRLLQMVADIEERLSRGDTSDFVAIDKLKSEVLKEQKVNAGKTRLYRVFGLALLIVIRRHYVDAAEWYKHNRVRNGVTIGVNPMSADWTFLAQYVIQKGDNCIAGDFKEWDARLLAVFILAAFEELDSYYVNATDREKKIRKAIAQGCISCRFVSFPGVCLSDVVFNVEYHSLVHVEDEMVDGVRLVFPLTEEQMKLYVTRVIYRLASGMASGLFVTGIVNSIANVLKLYYGAVGCVLGSAVDYRTEEHSELCSEVMVDVFPETHGDDNVVGFSGRLVGVITQQKMAEQMLLIGDIYTDELKTGEEVAPSRSITLCLFLQRRWKWDPKKRVYKAPIETPSIISSLYWREGAESERDIRERVRNALCDFSLKSDEEWLRYGPQILEQSQKRLNWVPEERTKAQFEAAAMRRVMEYR